MILGPFKQQAKNDKDAAEILRKKILADPEAHGLHGSLSDGVNRERMLELAREIEEREAKRLGNETNRAGNETNRANGETEKRGRETKGGRKMPRTGMRRKEARPLPETLTAKWLYRARSVELQKLLTDNGKPDTEGLSLYDLRAMARPLISARTRRSPKQSSERKKPVGVVRKKPREMRAIVPKLPDLANPLPPVSGDIIEIKAPCFCCGRVSLLTLRDGKVWRIEIL
jgi:hypothetical protein